MYIQAKGSVIAFLGSEGPKVMFKGSFWTLRQEKVEISDFLPPKAKLINVTNRIIGLSLGMMWNLSWNRFASGLVNWFS